MVGGTVVEVVSIERCPPVVYVKVQDGTDTQWRKLEVENVKIDDRLWWQSYEGFLTRTGEFRDKTIGSCFPSDPPS